jgi:hypothetical protein
VNIATRHIDKADHDLRQALARATKDQVLRAIVILDDPPTSADGGSPPQPADFATRGAYRRAAIDHRRASLQAHEGTLNALRALTLSVHGGQVGRAVVVEGPASRLLDGLDLPGVERALLDRGIELVRPRSPRSVDKADPRRGRSRPGRTPGRRAER